MTKFKNVKNNTKFVFSEEAGVYKKISISKAKCVWGPVSSVGGDTGVDSDANVLVIENTPRNEKKIKPDNDMIKIVIQDDEDNVVCERFVSMATAQIMSHSEVLCIRTAPDKQKELMTMGDVGFDLEDQTLHLEVMERQILEKDSK